MLTRLLIGVSSRTRLTPDLSAAQTPPPTQPPAETAPPTPNDYADPKSWLCRPGQDGKRLRHRHTTTVVAADGTLTKETWKANPSAPIDCFYVYPTVSTDPTPNSDMTADPAETQRHQAAVRALRVAVPPYAPLYRQVTLAGLRRVLAGGGGGAVARRAALQYDDVRDAFNYYLQNDNKGRGFVLVAHSQGSFILAELIRQGDRRQAGPVADGVGDPARDGDRRAERARTSAARSKHVPLCHSASQIGCVDHVRVVPLDRAAARQHAVRQGARCRHGSGVHESCGAWRRQRRAARLSRSNGRTHDHRRGAGEAVGDAGEANRHAVGQRAGPADGEVHVERQRVGISRGDGQRQPVRSSRRRHRRRPRRAPNVLANWGLHLVDVNLAMGNLVDIVGAAVEGLSERKK